MFYIAPILIIIISISVKTGKVDAYPNGAPTRTCETMVPEHSEQSLLSDMPFTITLDRQLVRGLGKITITVKSHDPSKYTFTGLLFIMKKPNRNKSFGTFDPIGAEKDLTTIDCFGKLGSGITHSHNQPKRMLRFQWTAPNDTSAEYELHATLVRDFNSFWANYIHPSKIRVSVDAPANQGMNKSLPALTTVLAAFVVAYLSSTISVCWFNSS